MKILILTEFFPRSNRAEITGGVEARCYYVAHHLRASHDVSIIAAMTDGAVWEYASWRSIPRRLLFLARAALLGMRADVDVIDSSNPVVHPLAWALGRLKRTPVVMYYPDVLIGRWIQTFGRVGLLGEAVERILLRLKPSRYILTSRATAERLVARGVPCSAIDLIPCGYEPRVTESVRRDPPAKICDICVVNRLVRYKRVDLILEALARLKGRMPNVTCIVIGRGPEQASLMKRAAQLGVDRNVAFRGFVPEHAAVLRQLAASRLFVSASEAEGFGIALVEAMSLGVPYVVSDIDAFREVSAEGTGGLLFRAGDAADLADKAYRLLSDRSAYRTASDAGHSVAQRYRWSEIAQLTEATYRLAVTQHCLSD